MTSKRIKQEQIKVTLPSELHSQLVTKSIDVLGEVNLSQYMIYLFGFTTILPKVSPLSIFGNVSKSS